MSLSSVVVDGSNIATEGRSLPSLSQLDQAVQEFAQEFGGAKITVVVDASFGHRIDPSEVATFEEAEAHGEIVSPPAGAIGRGDAFLLRIAEKSGAAVLSNDSFQEFHGEHEWLFDKDRLIGGKPVPGVGWIFTPRTPVRGPKSREAVKVAKRTRVRIGSKEASAPMPVPTAPPPRARSSKAVGADPAPERVGLAAATESNGPIKRTRKTQLAIDAAAQEAESPDSSASRRRRRRRGGSGPPVHAVNEPLAFITFIANHTLGAEVEGEVESWASHGAFVMVGEARCYIPLAGMGDPPPRSAREVMEKGERRNFVVQALDAQRRGIELALPGFARIAGAPTAETVEAEIISVRRSERKSVAAAKTTKSPAKK
ncbi:MAG: NYN domain-containing protein, partial [Acidimicrobiales bacterium]